jgi:hypothetical protein
VYRSAGFFIPSSLACGLPLRKDEAESLLGIIPCLMKRALVIFNLVAAVALIFLGAFVAAAHRTHAYSVYVELKQQNALVERPGYDVEKRLRTIAAGGTYSYNIAWMGAGICLANALAIGFLWKRPKP